MNVMSEQLTILGIILVLVGVIVAFIGIITTAFKSKESKVEAGGVVFIGPIPIIGATSKNALLLTLIMAATFILLFIIIQLLR